MITTSTLEHRADEALHAQHLPALAPADRLALAIGTQLILWGERHGRARSDRAARAEQARTAHAAADAATASRSTFEHRSWSGPTW